MVRVFLAGNSGVNVLAAQAGAKVRVADLGVDWDGADVPPEVTAHKIRRGSGSIDVEDALAPGEAHAAFNAGRAIAAEEHDADLLIPGDMGIGNTAVCAAVVAASLGLPAAEVVGTGTGVSEDGLDGEDRRGVGRAGPRGRPRRGPVRPPDRAGQRLPGRHRGLPGGGLDARHPGPAGRRLLRRGRPGRARHRPGRRAVVAGRPPLDRALAGVRAQGFGPHADPRPGPAPRRGQRRRPGGPDLRAARAIIADMGLLADLA